MSPPSTSALVPRQRRHRRHRSPGRQRRVGGAHGTARVARVALVLLALSCAALVTVGCGDGAQPSRPAAGSTTASLAVAHGPVTITDDAGYTLHLDRPVRRVISLIPSVNETLMAIGATDRIVGRTRYDVDPELSGVPSVGGGLDPSIEAIVALQPDVVIGWDNDKRRGVAERLAALGIAFVSLRTQDTTDMFRGIATLGALTGLDSSASAVAARLRAELDDVRRSVEGRARPAVMYVVFDDPASTVGRETFIGQVIGVAGGSSIFDDLDQLWPTVSLEEVVRRDPDIVVLPIQDTSAASSAAAVRALQGRAGWRDVRAVREGRVATVPTNLTNRPGPHLGAAARVLRDAIHPEIAGHAPVATASQVESPP